MERLIFDTRDIETVSKDILSSIDRAVVAAGFAIRDEMREQFKKDSSSAYQSHTGDIEHLANGIMIGKLKNGQLKLHALGSKEDYETYKTRFFVGGTIYRTQNQKLGQNIKPFTKGYIKAIDSVDRGMANGENILTEYIRNAIDGK